MIRLAPVPSLLAGAIVLAATAYAGASNGFQVGLEVNGRLSDRSLSGPASNATPLLPYGRLLPESELYSAAALRFAWNTNGRQVLEGALLFEKKNRLRDQILPTEDSLYQGGKTVMNQRDLSAWNALQDQGLNSLTDLWIDRLSARNLVVLDEISLGGRLRADWGPTVMQRDFQGILLRKAFSFGGEDNSRLSLEALGSVLYGIDRLSTAQAGKRLSDEMGLLFGAHARLDLVSNDNARLAWSWSFLRQARFFPGAGDAQDAPRIRALYLKIRSTARYSPNEIASTSYPVMIGRSSRAITLLDGSGRSLRSFDFNPEDEKVIADTRSFVTYRAVTRSSERSGSEVVFSATPKIAGNTWYDQYTNRTFFRQCDELTPGQGDYYRGEINLVFPLSGDGFKSEDVAKISVRLNVAYNYAYFVSFDRINWTPIDPSALRSIDPLAARTDLGNGLLVEQSDALNLYDQSWYGVNPSADQTNPPDPRATGFDLDLASIPLLKSRNVQALSFEAEFPRIGTRLDYRLSALRSERYAGSNLDSFAHTLRVGQSLFDRTLSFTFAYDWIDASFTTAFPPLGTGAVTSPDRTSLDGSLTEDRDRKEQGNVFGLADARRRWVPGYGVANAPAADRIALPEGFRRHELEGDANGNGWVDALENDARPDLPVRPGFSGYEASAAWKPNPSFRLALGSRLRTGPDATGATVRDESHRLVADLTGPVFFARGFAALLRDELRDDLSGQVYDNDSVTNVAESVIWAVDGLPNRDRKLLTLSAGFHLASEIGKGERVSFTNDWYGRIDGGADASGADWSVRAGARTEWTGRLPFRFENPLLDFTPEVTARARLGWSSRTGIDLETSGTVHLVKHFGPVDLVGGAGVVDMNADPFFIRSRYAVGLAALSFRRAGWEAAASWERFAALGGTSSFDQLSANLRVLQTF